MKKNSYSIIFLVSLLFINCDEDRCDDGYTEVTVNGQDICMPDFLSGEVQDFNLGNQFYHYDFGVISFRNDKWYDINDDEISIEQLEN